LKTHFTIILPSMSRFYNWSLSLRSSHHSLVCIYSISEKWLMLRPSHSSWVGYLTSE
jgi:hypothetical protein